MTRGFLAVVFVSAALIFAQPSVFAKHRASAEQSAAEERSATMERSAAVTEGSTADKQSDLERGEEPIDLLSRVEKSVGEWSYFFSLDFSPTGEEGLYLDESDQAVFYRSVVQEWTRTFGFRYQANDVLAFHAFINGRRLKKRERSKGEGPARDLKPTIQEDMGYGLGAELALSADHPLDPRLLLNIAPFKSEKGRWKLPVSDVELSASFLRDPVVLSGSVALEDSGWDFWFDEKKRGSLGSFDSLRLGVGAGFVANDKMTIGTHLSYLTPLSTSSVPSVSVTWRVGYAFDPEGFKELGLVGSLVFNGDDVKGRMGLNWSHAGLRLFR